MRRIASVLTITILSALALQAEEVPSRLQELATGDATRGWEAVGRIDLGHGSFCTGALIAKDMVLTAAHCLYDQDSGERIPISRIEFLAGWRNGRAEAYRGVRRAVTHPDYYYSVEDGIKRVSVDLALIQLDQPIRNPHITPFATRLSLKRGDEVGVVSYAQDRSEAPSLQQVCHVLEQAAGIVMLSCAVDFGASGAPIFAFGADGPQIVSVISAKAEADGERVALASEMRRAFGDLQAAMEKTPNDILNRGTPSGTAFSDGRGQGRLGAKFLKP